MYIFVFKVKARTCLFLSSLEQEFASGTFGQVFILFRIFIMFVDFISGSNIQSDQFLLIPLPFYVDDSIIIIQ